MKQSRVKVDARLTAWAFTRYMTAMVFGDTSESVDEVIGPRFFIVYIQSVSGPESYINNYYFHTKHDNESIL